MVRKILIATDGANIQVVENELSYLELLTVFSVLSDSIQNGKAAWPMPALQLPLKPAAEELKPD